LSKQFSAQAQSQALGYLYQVRYALLLLLKTGIEDPEAQISIEYLDDIAFEKDGNPVELIQAKHHVKKASLSDSSTDLWRTLRVWSENLLQGKLQLENVTLTLITTEHASHNTIASKLCPHDSGNRKVNEALDTLVSIAQSSESKANAQAYEAFLRLNQDQKRILLNRVQILDNSPNIIDTRAEIANYLRYTTRPKFLPAVQDRLEGWWFAIVIEHLFAKSPNIIPHRDLQVTLNDIQEQFHEDNLPIDYPDQIKVGEKDAEEDKRIFVEQLRLVRVSMLRVQKAISDFYRASEQRSHWIRDGLLLSKELERYEAHLFDEWERLFAIMQEDLENVDIDLKEESVQERGRSLFNTIQGIKLHVRSRCTEPYIMRGSFHILADRLYVGWHIDFHKRLKSFIA